MADSTSWPWLYQVRENDPKELGPILKELKEDEADLTELDFSDDHQSAVTTCVSVIGNESFSRSGESGENILSVNFKTQKIELPKFVGDLLSIDLTVKAKNVRYVAFATKGAKTEENDGTLILLSIWMDADRNIRNIFLELEDAKAALLLASAISKLVFEVNDKSVMRTHKFYPVNTGRVNVATCSVAERDKMEADYVNTEGKNEDEMFNEEDLPPGKLEEIPSYFAIDEETLLLVRHPFTLKPEWDLRFYKEEGPRSVDTIFICNNTGQLELQQQDKVVYIRDKDKVNEEKFQKLISSLKSREIKPKAAEVFTDAGKYKEFFNEKPKDDSPTPPAQAPANETTQPEFQIPPETQPQRQHNWLDFLKTGAHLQNATEDMQMMWIEKESSIEEFAKSGCLPDCNIESGGLDPNSQEHLLKTFEEIRTQLFSEQYGMALSYLDGCMKVFGSTLLSAVAGLDRVELMKRIFFLNN